jgi:hypothetical protein
VVPLVTKENKVKLQRYTTFVDFRRENPVGITAYVTEDKDESGKWILASDAEAMEKRVAKLEKVVLEIATHDDCGCADGAYCPKCICRDALEAKDEA